VTTADFIICVISTGPQGQHGRRVLDSKSRRLGPAEEPSSSAQAGTNAVGVSGPVERPGAAARA
jgi:hypothetical protein